jgi:GNAT superfamily N-acetyltransferase
MLKTSIRPLSPDLLDEYLSFFDRDAFCDNPEWQSCYCAFFHFYSRARVREWEARTGEQNRAMVSDLIRAGHMRGYLAFVGAKVVGWCHTAPRMDLPSLSERFDLPADEAGGIGAIGSIACFVVAKGHRRQGIARQLLDAACQGFRVMGLSCAEAYPHGGRETDADNYHGPLAMYLAAGFRPFLTRGNLVVVRKTLTLESS